MLFLLMVEHREEIAPVDRLAARGARVEVLHLVGRLAAARLAAVALQLVAPGDEPTFISCPRLGDERSRHPDAGLLRHPSEPPCWTGRRLSSPLFPERIDDGHELTSFLEISIVLPE